MKKYLFALLIFLFTINLSAQKYVERNLYFSLGITQKSFKQFSLYDIQYSGGVTELSMSLGHDFNSQHSLSVGISFYEAFHINSVLVPIVAEYRYYFTDNKNTWFANAAIGYNFLNDTYDQTSLYKLGLGRRFIIGKTFRLNFGLEYELNKIINAPRVEPDIFGETVTNGDKNLNIHCFNIRLGFTF